MLIFWTVPGSTPNRAAILRTPPVRPGLSSAALICLSSSAAIGGRPSRLDQAFALGSMLLKLAQVPCADRHVRRMTAPPGKASPGRKTSRSPQNERRADGVPQDRACFGSGTALPNKSSRQEIDPGGYPKITDASKANAVHPLSNAVNAFLVSTPY